MTGCRTCISSGSQRNDVPVSESLPDEAETAIASALGPSTPVAVKVAWHPPWPPERITSAAAKRLDYRQRGR
jgi:metal-sulfur cluster biosynthetic enzyme